MLIPQASAQEALSPGTCPHLGLRDDPDTCLSYPSLWNVCTHARPATGVGLEQQRQACLTPAYCDCPVLNRERPGRLPGALRAPRSHPGLRRRIWLALLLVLLGAAFWMARDRLPDQAWAAWQAGFARPTSAALAGPAPTALPTFPERTPLSTQAGLPAPASPSVAVQPTPSEPVLHCGSALEQPIPVGAHQIILHQVAEGESMDLLAEQYATSMEAILALNYFIPSPLWSELVIAIPSAALNVEDLPILEPFRLEGAPDSLAQVAAQAAVALPDLLEVQPLDPACQAYRGWILVPRPQKKTP